MLKRLTFILLLLFAKSTAAQVTQHFYTGEALKGKVKQLTESHFDVTTKGDNLKKSKLASVSILKYDSAGRVTELKEYRPTWRNGATELKLWHTYTYRSSRDSTAVSYIIAYKGNVRISKGRLDEAGKVIAMQFFDDKGKLTNTSTEQYTANYSEKLELVFDKQQKQEIKRKWFYNKDQILIAVQNFDSKGEITSTTRFQYAATDEYGNWIKRTSTFVKGSNTTRAAATREYVYYQ